MASANRINGPLLSIGELAARTGTTTRMLRHYENQGLLEAERSSKGHRLFDPAAAVQVHYIKTLLTAGLPTRVIGELIGCIHTPGQIEPCAVPTLLKHLQGYELQIAGLVNVRDTLQGLIDASAPRWQAPQDRRST